ncbi:MAG: helix-turn-helix domain-containing protein [Candidatus Hadarchaeum sp.]
MNLKELLKQGNLIRPDELAEGLKVAQATIYQWVKRGKIPHLQIEKCIRFDPQEIDEWLRYKHKAATRPLAVVRPLDSISDFTPKI